MRKVWANKRGAALVEFAIVSLLLVTLLFGIIEFGLLMKDYLTLSQATREGARSAALRSDSSVVVYKVKNSATTLDVNELSVAPYYRIFSSSTWGDWQPGVPDDTTLDSEVQVRVNSTYNHKLIVGSLFGLGDSVTLSSDMVMRRE